MGPFLKYLKNPFKLLLKLPVLILSAPQTLAGMSLPTRVAWLVAIFLTGATVFIFVANSLRDDAGTHGEQFQFLIPLIVLIVVIPLATRHVVKLWVEGETSYYPDLDRAWSEGLAALEDAGIEMDDVPVFLVIGAGEQQQAKSLCQATDYSYDVEGCPSTSDPPLQWYANGDMILLFLCDCAQSSWLAKYRQTSSRPVDNEANVQKQVNLRGTMLADADTVRVDLTASQPTSESAAPEPGFNIRGTMIADDGATDAGRSATPVTGGNRLSQNESSNQKDRLQHICRLLRRTRDPVCPVNGVLSLVSFEQLESSVADAVELQRAIRADADVIVQTTQIICPVTALVTGLEEHAGFRELVRRVGPTAAQQGRFGKGFDCRNVPSSEQLEALSLHACGAFEDWVYRLFREKDALRRPGNSRLFSLLFLIRSTLRNRLKNLLVNAFASDGDDGAGEDETLLFSGCYFAAAGKTEEQQAFVQSVFEKLVAEEEDVQWTPDAIDDNDRYHRWSRMAMGVNGVLVLVIVILGFLAFR